MGYGLFPTLFVMNFSWDKIMPNEHENAGESQNLEHILEIKIQRVFLWFLVLASLFILLCGVDTII
jgi:hypothetical protein